MICEHCEYEADMVSSVDRALREELHEKYRKHDMGHDQCQGCDCQHKNVGAWNGGR